MNYARLLALPFIVLIVITLYRIFVHDLIYLSVWIAVGVIPIVIIMIFEPQINWRFWKKWPPKMDDKLLKIIYQFWPQLKSKDDFTKKKLINRLVLYPRAHDIRFFNEADLPLDIKTMLASIPIRMTENTDGDEYLMMPFERIYFYKNSFPTPDHPYLHTSETHLEDAVLLFSLEQFLASFREPATVFPIGFYEFAAVYLEVFRPVNLPSFDENDKKLLEDIGPGFTIDQVMQINGYRDINYLQYAIVCFFCYPDAFQTLDPGRYQALANVFNA